MIFERGPLGTSKTPLLVITAGLGVFTSTPLQHIAEFFGKEAILAILNQQNCVGIRIYYGQEPNSNKKHLVIVGAEPNKNDIYNGYIAERGASCPSFCGVPNPINT